MKNRTLNKILVVLISTFGCVGVASAITVGADQQWNDVTWRNSSGFSVTDNYVYLQTSGNDMSIRLDEFATHNSDANNNTSLGTDSLNSNTSGNQNTAIGSHSLENTTTGWQNTAIGATALYSNTTGNSNTALGTGTLADSTTGSYNTAIGDNILLHA